MTPLKIWKASKAVRRSRLQGVDMIVFRTKLFWEALTLWKKLEDSIYLEIIVSPF